jgi:hypothetical protein
MCIIHQPSQQVMAMLADETHVSTIRFYENLSKEVYIPSRKHKQTSYKT